jgi:YbgC/YbaW family acyl-CoA thioester hydrolase
MPRNPIKYHGHMDIRFSDLDYYGHVNSKHYVDFVSTVRLLFLSEKLQFPIEKVAANGIGFYMTKSIVNYKRPIIGLQKVFVQSHVDEVRDGKILIIPFSISSLNEGKDFADGTLEFTLIDMSTKRSTIAPSWLLDLFFEK